MLIGKLIKRNGEHFIKDVTNDCVHHVENADGLDLFGWYAFEINEDDEAVDLKPAREALIEYGIRPDTGSFYVTKPENESDSDAPAAESYFGTCEISGMRGDIVPCLYLSTDGSVVEVNAGTWLVHSVLGQLAGAF